MWNCLHQCFITIFWGWTSGSCAIASMLSGRMYFLLFFGWVSLKNLSYNDDCICVIWYHGECNLKVAVLSGTAQQMICRAIGYNLWSYIFTAIWTATITLGRLQSSGYCPSFRQFHIPCFCRTMPVTYGEDFESLLWRTTYGWLATSLLWCYSNHSWCFVYLHTNCMEGDSPSTYPALFDFMPQGLEALIAAHGDFSLYWNLRSCRVL